MSDSSHLLIVGPPRSGTTLLVCLVGRHSACIALSECYSAEEHKVVSPAEVLVNKLCVPNHIQFENSLPFLLRRLVRLGWTKPVERLGGILKDRPMSAFSIREYVEKRSAQLLFILRDPDQAVDSMIHRAGNREKKSVSRWAYGIREMMKSYSAYESRSYILTFSDLLENTGQTIRRVCNFIGVEYQREMAEGYEMTPQYQRGKIDPSRASKEVPGYRLEERFPEAYEMYLRLRKRANRNRFT